MKANSFVHYKPESEHGVNVHSMSLLLGPRKENYQNKLEIIANVAEMLIFCQKKTFFLLQIKQISRKAKDSCERSRILEKVTTLKFSFNN